MKGFFDFLNFKGVTIYAQQKNWIELAYRYNGEARDYYGVAGADAYKEKLPIAYDAAKEVLTSN